MVWPMYNHEGIRGYTPTDGVAQLKEVLKVSVCVLTWQTTELVCLHHRDEASLELKVSNPCVDNGPNGHVGNSRGGVVAK
jgi:hypothetical protein